ncbi:hypothetical protein ILP97_33955 [Amycolatopsis sp. H6(2020)]|nr:hypothetical protein [Amycolatopsis sp. H6(2020)]
MAYVTRVRVSVDELVRRVQAEEEEARLTAERGPDGSAEPPARPSPASVTVAGR